VVELTLDHRLISLTAPGSRWLELVAFIFFSLTLRPARDAFQSFTFFAILTPPPRIAATIVG